MSGLQLWSLHRRRHTSRFECSRCTILLCATTEARSCVPACLEGHRLGPGTPISITYANFVLDARPQSRRLPSVLSTKLSSHLTSPRIAANRDRESHVSFTVRLDSRDPKSTCYSCSCRSS